MRWSCRRKEDSRFRGNDGWRVFGLAALLTLSSCGFTPLYGGDGGTQPTVSQQLEQVKVANIPERNGQLLRLSLQNQMQRDGMPTVERYVLNVNYSIAIQAIGIQQDTSATRERFSASATWSLSPIGTPEAKLINGLASTEDAANVIDQQYFQLTLETSTVDQQLADEIAAQITAQVAAYFKTHPDAG